MTITYRPIVDDEFEAMTRAQARAFGFDYRPEETMDRIAVLPPERTLCAFEGAEIAGTAGAYALQMTVPGGDLPCAGVSMVSVQPTHRRRGILRGMMERQLAQAREWSEPIAALWATESIIYGRFGYGLASQNLHWEIAREHTAIREDVPSPGKVRLVRGEEEAAPIVFPLYERARRERPGAFVRSETWWRSRHFGDYRPRQSGYTGNLFAIYEEDGAALGYLRYRQRFSLEKWLPTGNVNVAEWQALTPAAWAGLARYLFGIDLVAGFKAAERPLDEPVLALLQDPRRLQRQAVDSLWLRVVDVPAALVARRYAREGSVVLALSDRTLPSSGGTFRLEGGPAGAACVATTATADLHLDAEALGAAYLGGTTLAQLARAGRLDAASPAALERASAMFAWDPPPWCPEIF